MAVGLGLQWCVSAGDAHGGRWGYLVSEPVWPWYLLVAVLGASAGSWLSAVLCSTLSVLIMLYGYYRARDQLAALFDPGGWGESTPFYWLVAALTVVPLVAVLAYQARCVVLKGFRSVLLRRR
ncbi:hypothetical protein [Streptomyces sp. cg35]|uniref:hypothetical protein n=1 Tax=Streptomyces sp. cg35 TaxID=3421650 RepID=UPI003D184F69